MDGQSDTSRLGRRLLILLLVGGFLLFFRVGAKGFWPSSEDRTAEIVREMYETGDFLLPRMRGEPLVTKPPLLHWLIVGTTSVLGLNEFAIRLPSLCFALGTALVLFLVGRRWLPERAAFLAAVAFLTAPILLRHWRTAKIDVLLTLLTTAALFAFFAAVNRERNRAGLFALFFGFIGLAGMAKGPAGMGPPLLVALVYLVATRQWRALGRVPWAWGVPMALIVGLWWYGAMVARLGGWSGLREVTGGGAGTYFGWQHEVAPAVSWFYIPRILADFFPWSFFLPVAVVLAVRKVRAHENRLFGLLLAWMAVYFVLFSLLGKKAGRYILPLYPAAALLVGFACHEAVQRLASRGTARSMQLAAVAVAVVCLVGLVLVVSVAAHADYESWYVTRRWTESKDRLILSEVSDLMRGHMATTLLVGGGLFAAFAVGAALWRRRGVWAFGLIAAAAAGSNVAFDVGITPTLDRMLSPRHFARHIAQLVPRDAPLAGYCEASGQIDDCTHFYLGRAVQVLTVRRELRDWATKPPPRYVFMLEEDLLAATGVVYEWFELVDDSTSYRGQKVLLFANRPEHSAPPEPAGGDPAPGALQ
jgi:4-amino-4-deoxy-L-arabinose transferase-like glycosyltransferase